MTHSNALLEPSFLHKLDRLSLAARKPFPGRSKGEKRSTRSGSSIEFADYREYAPGDDLRYVDWNTAARLDRMYLKLFVEEEDLFLALLVDSSRSMEFGEPTKLRFALQIAAALGYVGLCGYDRVTVQTFAESLGGPSRAGRGKAAAGALLKYLDAVSAGGGGSLSQALRRFAYGAKAKGIAVVLSDFMDSEWRQGLNALLARGFQVTAIQVLCPEEVEPRLRGDLRVIDSETGASKEMSVNPQLLARYRAALAEFCAELESYSLKRGIDYIRVATSQSWEEVVLTSLLKRGLLR